MNKKLKYITPTCETWDISHEQGIMLVLSVHNEETEIVGAKENSFDFDDDPWGDDSWSDTPAKDPWKD
jgi:hypothetical protein